MSDRYVVRELVPRPSRGFEQRNHVLDGRRHEKVLLLQPKLLPVVRGVVGVEDAADAHCALAVV